MSTLPWLDTGRPALIGMIHLDALPGTPRSSLSFEEIRRRALAAAKCLSEEGYDALIVENMGDTPYLRRSVGPEIIAAMTVIVRDIVQLGKPVGVQVLAGANQAALAVAEMSGACFVRAEGFTFGHLADEGWMNADAGQLLRFRRQIQSDIRVFCDVQKKHASHAVSADISLSDWIETAQFCGADGVIITGRMTGHAPEPNFGDASVIKRLPILIGSGITPENVVNYHGVADGLIVGSYLKHDGHWLKDVSRRRAQLMRSAVDALLPAKIR